MRKPELLKSLALAVVVAFVVTGCATPLMKAQETGGTIVERNVIAQIGDKGVTHIDSTGAWVAYYGPDGRKVVRVNSNNETAELKWRKDENGQFCEENYSDKGKETCGNPAGIVYVKNDDGSFSSFGADGQLRYKWRVEEGNSYDL